MTHTLGSVSAKMTFDKEYQEQRNHDSVNSVRGVKEGFSRAGEKLIGGFAGGLLGVVTKPVQGAKDQGASGFFKVTVQKFVQRDPTWGKATPWMSTMPQSPY